LFDEKPETKRSAAIRKVLQNYDGGLIDGSEMGDDKTFI
jgi:hypothetical protein